MNFLLGLIDPCRIDSFFATAAFGLPFLFGFFSSKSGLRFFGEIVESSPLKRSL